MYCRIKNRLDRAFDAEAVCGGYRDVLVNGVFLTPHAVSHGVLCVCVCACVLVCVCVLGGGLYYDLVNSVLFTPHAASHSVLCVCVCV